jgi:hypothetical protein
MVVVVDWWFLVKILFAAAVVGRQQQIRQNEKMDASKVQLALQIGHQNQRVATKMPRRCSCNAETYQVESETHQSE